MLGPRSDGVHVEVVPGVQGHVPTAELDITHYPDLAGFKPGALISVKVLEVSLSILCSGLHSFLHASYLHACACQLLSWTPLSL